MIKTIRISRFRLSVLLLLVVGVTVARGSSYQFRHYDTNEGLSQNSVMTIVQDSMGFMWFGTHDGLNRFDGNSFKVYRRSTLQNGLSNGRVGVIWLAPDNELWLGTERGIYIYSPTTDSFRSFNVQTADGQMVTGQVNVISGYDDQVIISCIGLGIYLYDLQWGVLTHHPLEGYPTVSSICVDAGKTVWIGFYEGGLAYTRNQFRSIVNFKDAGGETVLNRQTITGMVPTDEGLLYLCSSEWGLSKLDINGKQLAQLTHTADGMRLYAHSMIQSDKELLVATENGLYI